MNNFEKNVDELKMELREIQVEYQAGANWVVLIKGTGAIEINDELEVEVREGKFPAKLKNKALKILSK